MWLEIFLVLVILFGYFFLAMEQVSWWRIGFYFMLIAGCGALIVASIGRPTPSWLLISTLKGKIVSVLTDEQTQIYIWMLPEGDHVPRSIVVPFSQQRMAKLEQGMADAKAAHESLQGRVKGIVQQMGGMAGGVFDATIKRRTADGHAGQAGAHDPGADSLGGADPYIQVQLRPITPWPLKSDH